MTIPPRKASQVATPTHTRTSARTRQLASRVGNLSRHADQETATLRDTTRVEHQASRALDEITALITLTHHLGLPLPHALAAGLHAAIEQANKP